MTIAENLTRVRTAIDAACERAGRPSSQVRLLPVSKTFGTDAILEAYEAGIRLFGENKVQEAVGKAARLADHEDLRWAMIGHLQRNKAREVAAFASEFHALDSLRLAEVLQHRLEALDRTLDVFIEVNSSGEDSKFGLPLDEVADLAAGLRSYDRLRPRGLMTIAARSDDQSVVEGCFARMAQLRERLRDNDKITGSYEELSMGMSGDFELAIVHGATTVRIGTAIFGSRPPTPNTM